MTIPRQPRTPSHGIVRAKRSTSPGGARFCIFALRAPKGAQIFVDGADVAPEVHAVLDKIAECVKQIRSGVGPKESEAIIASDACRHHPRPEGASG